KCLAAVGPARARVRSISLEGDNGPEGTCDAADMGGLVQPAVDAIAGASTVVHRQELSIQLRANIRREGAIVLSSALATRCLRGERTMTQLQCKAGPSNAGAHACRVTRMRARAGARSKADSGCSCGLPLLRHSRARRKLPCARRGTGTIDRGRV